MATYNSESLAQAGYRYLGYAGHGTVVLQVIATGQREVWVYSPNYAGYTVRYKGRQYEFCYEVTESKARELIAA